MFQLVLVLMIVLPVAWLISEFGDNRGARITLGVLALTMSFGVAWAVGSLDRLRSNTYFGEATKDLVQNTIIELEHGRTEEVLAALRQLRAEFRPTYESRDDYDVLVDKYVDSISDDPVRHEGGDTRWSHEIAGDAAMSTTVAGEPAHEAKPKSESGSSEATSVPVR